MEQGLQVLQLRNSIATTLRLMIVCLGSYGNFEIMPLICPGGFDTCTPNLAGRERPRMSNTDGELSIEPHHNILI